MPQKSNKLVPQLSEITHNLLNALASVHSLSEILQDNPGIEARQRKRFLEIILSETQRLIGMVHHLPEIPDSLASISKRASGHGCGVNADRLTLCKKPSNKSRQAPERETSI